MEREAARQSQSEHRESSNGSQSSSASDPAPSSSSSAPSPVTPTPPRLTPNPLLLDCPSAPLPTPTTCSPPPPLTPAPSLSSSHVTKTATPTSPHLLVPAPPKLTSTATPALRTYARPILPSPAKTQTAAAAAAAAATAASTAATTPAAPTTNTTSSSSTASLSTKTSNTLTNGSTRTVATTTATPITPFHTPASPPGRQVSQSLPVGTPGLARANQSAAPVRQRVSQQTLLLGKGLKGTGQDQVLLRAQMLQSLTLRPPPPGALTIPPSLRLKPPTSTSVTAAAAAPPLLSRPQTPLFPPLRPRPVTTTTESATTTASRHLSVPPPTLYSPVRAVPLRPRLLSPNGHRSPSPKQPLHPIAAAAPSSTGPSPINRPISGIKTCPLSPTLLAPGQPPTSSPCFERSPSAARQLQIIALSSGRQLQTAAGAPLQKMRVNSESQTVLPLSPTLPKMSAPLPSPTTQKVDVKEKLKQESHEDGTAAKDLKVGTVDQREREKSKVVIEKEDSIEAKKPRREEKDEAMDVAEQGQSGQKTEEEKKMADVGTEVTDQSKKGQNPEGPKDSNNETKPRISEPIALTTAVKSSPLPAQNASPESIPAPLPLTVPVRPQIAPPPSLSTTAAATVSVPAAAVQNSSPVPSAVPVTSPVSVPVQEVTPNQSNQKFAELHSTNQDDNVSIQSDNQSALSSLSSQSPPSSPFVSPSADPPLPPLPPPQPERPTDLRLNHKQPDQTQNNSQHREPDAQPEPPNQSEDEEAEGFDQSESGHWEPRAWPEGQQVLTHLVEGFVIQEGLTPFPVNRSSLLVPEQVPKPQEVNGTNGSAALPVAPETRKPTEHSTDSEEEEEGRDTDDPNSRPSQRDRAVLHCQFCGKRGHAHNFMRSKRFCSTSCARGFNVRLTKRLRALSAGSRPERPRPVLNRAESVPGKPLLLRLPRDLWSAGRRDKEVKDKPPAAAAAAAAEEEDMELEAGPEEDDEDDGPEEEEDEDEEDDEEEEEDEPAVSMTTTPNNNNNNTVARTTTESVALHRPRRASAPAVTTTTPTTTFKPAPSQWSVEEVTAFINTLPGCGDIAEAFRVQEIDGQALLLLTEDHLMSSMNIKLGPALKICAHINTLKNP